MGSESGHAACLGTWCAKGHDGRAGYERARGIAFRTRLLTNESEQPHLHELARSRSRHAGDDRTSEDRASEGGSELQEEGGKDLEMPDSAAILDEVHRVIGENLVYLQKRLNTSCRRTTTPG